MTGRRILVVEDNSIISMETVDRLRRLGYHVCGTASTGNDAIDLAAATNPDCILMDINLKGEMDGIEAAQQITARRPVSIIYVTAYSDEETIRRANASHPVRYLIKPYWERDLSAALDEILIVQPQPAVPELSEETRVFADRICRCSDGIIAIGSGGEVQYLNERAGQITGWTLDHLAGRPLSEIVTPGGTATTVTDPCATGSATNPALQCTLTTAAGRKVPACVVMIGPDQTGAGEDLSFAVFWVTAGSAG